MVDPTQQPIAAPTREELERQLFQLAQQPQATPSVSQIPEDQLAQLRAMADQEKQANLGKQLANIGSSIAEGMTGAQRGARTELSSDAKKRLLQALGTKATAGKTAGDQASILRDLYRSKTYEQLQKEREEGKDVRQEKSQGFREKQDKWKNRENIVKQERDLIEDFNKDKIVSKIREQVKNADSALTLLESKNPIGDKAIRPFMARLTGEVGNLTEAEQAVFSGNPQLWEWAKRTANIYLVDGTIPDSDRALLTDLAKQMRDAAAANYDKEARRYADMLGDDKITTDAIYRRVMEGSYNKSTKPVETKKGPTTQPKPKQEQAPTPTPQADLGLSEEELKELEELEKLEAEGKL